MKEKKEIEAPVVDETIQPLQLEGHKPKTRREFLAQGFLGMTAFALSPTALSLLSAPSAYGAANCAPAVFAGLTGVIIIDLAGGGNIAGSNVVVGGQGGQLDFLPGYESLGLPASFHPRNAGMTDNEMGLVFHSDSGMLRGIRSVAGVATRVNCEGAIFCTQSSDDTSNNQSNPIYWLNKAGAKGQLNQLAGTSQSTSGGNSMPPAESVNPSVAPVRLSSNQDAINLVSLGGKLGTFSASKIEKILETMGKLSSNKLNAIQENYLPQKIRDIVDCGYVQTADQIKRFGPNAVDPAQDAVVTAVMNGITNNTIRSRTAPMAKLVVDGFVGVGTIQMGGYDYHTGDRSQGEVKDFELGQVIGSILELAARKQKDIVIYVLTDGGVAANATIDNSTAGRGKFAWGGDSGQRSSSFMMVYKKDGKPSLRTGNRQVGYFKATGSVETTALVTSNSVINTSKAMVANYLALHGQEGTLLGVVGDNPFINSGLDKYLVFDKMR